jgi:putative oxidoreductase
MLSDIINLNTHVETMLRLTHHFHAPARLLMSTLFLLSGIGKLGAIKATKEYMEAYGVPGYLIYPAAALEITGGVMLLLGVFTRPLSLVLAGWCLLTAAIFHKELTDQTQQIMFFKNMVMAGGFLVLSDHGAPGHSLDDQLSLAQKYKKVRSHYRLLEYKLTNRIESAIGK